MYVDLIQNAALLVALCALYSLLSRLQQRHELWRKVCLGLLFGGVTIAGMMMPLHYAPGIIFDGRSIVLTLAGLFGGGICAAIAAVLAGAYRAFLGGAGIWAGLATIAVTPFLGLLFRRKADNHPERYGPLSLYGIGIVAHLAMLTCQLLLPWPGGLTVIQNIWLPVMLVFPATTLVIGLLIGNEEQRLVTQRKLAENQELLSKSQAIGNVGSWEYDIAEDTLLWSDQAFRIFGVDPEKFAVTYEAFLECVHPDDREAVDSAYTRSVDEGQDGYEIEHRIVRQDTGEIRFVQQRCLHHKDSAGRIVRSIGIVRDITGRKIFETQLRKERDRAQSYLDIAGVMIVALDTRGNILLINKKGCDILGYDAYELIGANWFELCLPERLREEVMGVFRQLMSGNIEPVEYYENPVLTKSGDERIIAFHSTFLHDENSSIIGGLFSGEDITERKKAEEALRRSEQELRVRNEILSVFLTASDEDMYSEVLSVIRKATKSRWGILGYIDENENWVCPSLTRDVWDECQIPAKHIIFPKEKWVGIWGRAMLEKKTFWSNEPFKVPEGHVPITRCIAVPVLYAGQLIGNIVLANKETPYHEADVALVEAIANQIAPILNARLQRDREERAREKLQEQFQQAQKLESVGRLAGGVAHDFNNMLSVILGHGEIVRQKLHPGDPLREDVEAILKAGRRSADLTRQLLAFSRKQTLQPEVLDLNDVIGDIEKMLHRLIGEDIALELALSGDLSPVKVDRGQMEQVIMNLAVNARDAMPTGGKLLIETSEVELDEAYAQSHPGVTPGRYVMLAVTDTGCGVDKEVLSQIFDPFFTTKEKGKGTGLGLSTVYGIVKQSGGNIWAYSEPGQGTTFKIYLPVTGEQAKTRVREAAQEEPTGGGEHILVVEDEEDLRGLLKMMLSRLGYKVSLAANGREALLLVEEKGLKPDLIITDVVMPGMSGSVLVERLRRNQPDLKVLFMSGYTDNAIVHHGVLDPGTPFIQKPFTIAQIAEKVRAVLRGQGAHDEP